MLLTPHRRSSSATSSTTSDGSVLSGAAAAVARSSAETETETTTTTTTTPTMQKENNDDDDNALKPSKKRIRAIVACSHCRSKRSKCDGVPGKKPCTPCRQRAIPCEMSDGKRNRGHYKPQVEALRKQVQMLQQALAEAQAANQALLEQQQQRQRETGGEPLHPLQHHLSFDGAHSFLVLPDMDAAGPGLLAPQHTAASIAVSTTRPAGLAPSSLAPHLYMDPRQSHVPPHYAQHRGHAVHLARALAPAPPPSTAASSPDGPPALLSPLSPLADYLLGLYFHRYQTMMKFVSQRDFMLQHYRNPAQSMRSGLFLAMVAAGLRYSTRADVTARFLRRSGGGGDGDGDSDGDGENLLATAARRAVETELARPTLATVQTVLILGEVETSLGHPMTGYMYCCLASKLIFEMGLDPGSCEDRLALCPEATTIRHWLVWSASVQEQYWGVFLRRPVTIKNQTLQMSRLVWRFSEGFGGDGWGGAGAENEQSSFEREVDEGLFDLMEMTRDITDELYGHGSLAAYHWDGDGGGRPGADDGAAGGGGRGVARPYVPDLDRLDARLDDWFGSLSERIRTGPVSGGRDCYHFLFVLHLIFNTTKIVVHRERAAVTATAAAATTTADQLEASRRTMGAAAVRIAKLFAMFRRREDIRALKSTGVQWAALAADALVRYIETLPIDGAVEAVAHLQSLQRTLRDMTCSFRPAADVYAATAHAVATFQRRMDGDEESPGGSVRGRGRGGGGGGENHGMTGVDEVGGLGALDGLDGLDGLDRLDGLDGLNGLDNGALLTSSAAAAAPTATMAFGMDPPPSPSHHRHHHNYHSHHHQAHRRRHTSTHVLQHPLHNHPDGDAAASAFSASLVAATSADPLVTMSTAPDAAALSTPSMAWWEQGPLGQ